MNFKTDENLPVVVAELLRLHGHDALSVIDQQLAGHPDEDVAEMCQAEQRALVTLDLDFADIRAYPPEDYSGIIILRPGLQNIPTIMHLVGRAIPLLATEPLTGHLWIVEERRVRIRGRESSSPPS